MLSYFQAPLLSRIDRLERSSEAASEALSTKWDQQDKFNQELGDRTKALEEVVWGLQQGGKGLPLRTVHIRQAFLRTSFASGLVVWKSRLGASLDSYLSMA